MQNKFYQIIIHILPYDLQDETMRCESSYLAYCLKPKKNHRLIARKLIFGNFFDKKR